MSRKSLPSLAVLSILACAGMASSAAFAQEAVPTSSGDGYVDPDAKMPKPGSGPVHTAPATKTLYKGPFDRLADIPRSNILSNVHGSVGVMVGTHNTRAAYASVHGPIGDNASFALNFATMHSDAMPLYDGGYGGYGGYGAREYGDVSDLYPSGAALGYGRGGYGRGYGYGYGSGTSTSVAASVRLGDHQSQYDRVWPNYTPPRGEETTDVTDEPLSSSE